MAKLIATLREVSPFSSDVRAVAAIVLEVVVVVVVVMAWVRSGKADAAEKKPINKGRCERTFPSIRFESPPQYSIARGLRVCAAEFVGVGGGGQKFEEEARQATKRRRRAITTNTSSHQRRLVTTTATATAQKIDGSINSNCCRAVSSRRSS
jgi:hypothetical protein